VKTNPKISTQRTHNRVNHPIRYWQAMEGDRHWLGCRAPGALMETRSSVSVARFASYPIGSFPRELKLRKDRYRSAHYSPASNLGYFQHDGSFRRRANYQAGRSSRRSIETKSSNNQEAQPAIRRVFPPGGGLSIPLDVATKII
jgi:hypothetical protein